MKKTPQNSAGADNIPKLGNYTCGTNICVLCTHTDMFFCLENVKNKLLIRETRINTHISGILQKLKNNKTKVNMP